MTLFKTRVANLRKQNNLSQTELSKRLKVARSTVAMWETGDREPDYETLKKIAELFHVSVDFLLGRSETSSPPIDPEQENVYVYDMHDIPSDEQKRLDETMRFLMEQTRKYYTEKKKEED